MQKSSRKYLRHELRQPSAIFVGANDLLTSAVGRAVGAVLYEGNWQGSAFVCTSCMHGFAKGGDSRLCVFLCKVPQTCLKATVDLQPDS